MKTIWQYYENYKQSMHALSIYLLSNLIQLGIAFGLTPVLASNMSARDFAIIGYYESFALFILPFIGFSFSSYYSRNFFLWTEQQRQDALNTLVVFQLIFGTISLAILLAALKLYFIYQNIQFPFFPYAFLSFLFIYVQNVYSFFALTLKLRRQARLYFRTNLVYNLLNVAMAILLVVIFKLGAGGRMAGLLITGVFIATYALMKQLRKLKVNFQLAKEALHFTWPLMISALLTYFFTGFDKLLLERIDDVPHFGLYNIASKIVSYFMIFSVTIDATFEPDVFKAIAQKDKRKLIKIVGSIMSLKIVPVLIFICSARLVIGLLTNYHYMGAVYFARILAFSSITQSISFTLSILIVAFGFSRIALIEKSIAAVLVVCLYVLLIRNFGFDGAAWGQVLSYVIMSLISGGFILYLYKRNRLFVSVKNTP